MTTGNIIEDIYRRKDGISEADAGGRLRGCADIMVDFHLLPCEWIELVQRRSTSLWSDVDESEDEHWLKENASVSRNTNSAYLVDQKINKIAEHTPSRR